MYLLKLLLVQISNLKHKFNFLRQRVDTSISRCIHVVWQWELIFLFVVYFASKREEITSPSLHSLKYTVCQCIQWSEVTHQCIFSFLSPLNHLTYIVATISNNYYLEETSECLPSYIQNNAAKTSLTDPSSCYFINVIQIIST